VTRIDARRGLVVVGEREAAERHTFEVGELEWLGGAPRAGGRLRVSVQVRHRGRPLEAEVELDGVGARVALSEQVVAAPGQAAVFYDGDAVLGGGWIR
jgi:tRNA-specific 2-thiouridylase